MPDNEQNYPEHVAESSEYSNEYLRTIGVELGVKVESQKLIKFKMTQNYY